MSIAWSGLAVAAVAELLRIATCWRRDDGVASRIAKAATWVMRPIAAACAVNAVFRLCGFDFSNPVTYPFYANEWWPREWSVAMRLRAIASSDGVIPWLPLSLALAAFGSAAAYWVARARHVDGRSSPECAANRVARATAPLLVAAFCFSMLVSVNCLPMGLFTGEGQRSSLLSNWHEAGSTMLYSVPAMFPNVKAYLRDFHKIQPHLSLTVHAKSHPPVASTFVRWIGKTFGVDVNDRLSYRDAHARLRYALGQTFFTSLNAILVFLIGLAMFDWRTGMLASILWSAAPSVCGYGTFAPDMNYALFFHGAILFTWLVATARSPAIAFAWGVPLGLCFAMLALMTFSWCIMTTISAVFILAASARAGRPLADQAARIALPLAVMALSAGYVILHYQIRYLEIYRTASAFVSGFYLKQSFWEKAMAFAGGQAEWLVLLGPLTCSGFILWMCGNEVNPAGCRQGPPPPRRLFALVLTGVFLIPVLLGPACLKHEVARCWIWMAAVPSVLAAHHWLTASSPRMCAAAAAASALASISLRLLVCFLA